MGQSRVRYLVQQEVNGAQPFLHAALALSRVLPDLVGNRFRSNVLRMAGVGIGQGTVVGGGIRIVGVGRCQDRVTIGAHGWINAGCYFDATERIDIGDDVAFGQEVLVLTQTHEVGDERRRAGPLVSAAVKVGDGCWIGARSVLLPGITVGRGSIVAAGAVVVHDVPPNVLVGGVPARVIRTLETRDAEHRSVGEFAQ